jgi:hypothetical protein
MQKDVAVSKGFFTSDRKCEKEGILVRIRNEAENSQNIRATYVYEHETKLLIHIFVTAIGTLY